MSFILNSYYWPPQDLSAVAAAQTASAGASLMLNGTLAKKYANDGTIDFPGISRNIVITLSSSGSANFIISGLRNNQIITETLTIANGTNANSTNFFDSITSITSPSGTGLLQVNVGTGVFGMTRPLVPNTFLTDYPVATAIHTTVSGSISYSVIGSIEKWSNTNMNNGLITSPTLLYLNQGTANSTSGQYLTPSSAIASSFITVEGLPLTMVCVNVNGGTGGSLKVNITSPRLLT
jgi:hypothetical protein